jgi:hypothetical protein
MRKINFTLAVILISVASYAATGDEPGQGFSSPSTRTVSGTEIGHYKNGPFPVDLSTATIGAFAPNGAGGYTFLPGTGTSSGTFTIPNVPRGFYLLQFGALYLWTKNTTVDADYNSGDRSDTVQADQNTTVTFDLTNLHAWQDTDFFEMVCPNNGSFDNFVGTTGQTTLTGTFPYLGSLSVGSEGDQYYLIQLITQNVGGLPFFAAGRYLAPPKFNQAQGSDTPINGKLKTVPQTNKFEANINGADLAAQALAANPNATLDATVIALDVYPGSLAKGENTSTPDLVGYDFVNNPLLTTNGDLGPVSYGNPFPSKKWPLFDLYQWQSYTLYTAPGATNSAPIFASAIGYDAKLPTSANPIKPLVGVLSKPSIDHKNFFADHTGVGTTPTLKWSPPSVGKATFYAVQIFQVANNGGNTTTTLIARLITQRASLLIPKGLLSAGQAYVFKIRAWYTPGINFAKTPFMNGPTIAVADVVSGLMQP